MSQIVRPPTARSVPEWIGSTPDTNIPDRVKLRVFDRDGGRCQHPRCGIRLGGAFPRPEFDHIIALANGGENRESNIQLLCPDHHKEKTAADVATKSRIASVRAKHVGITKSKWPPLPGTKRSGLRKRMNGKVEKW